MLLWSRELKVVSEEGRGYKKWSAWDGVLMEQWCDAFARDLASAKEWIVKAYEMMVNASET